MQSIKASVPRLAQSFTDWDLSTDKLRGYQPAPLILISVGAILFHLIAATDTIVTEERTTKQEQGTQEEPVAFSSSNATRLDGRKNLQETQVVSSMSGPFFQNVIDLTAADVSPEMAR